MAGESRSSHVERTAAEPRQAGLHRVWLSSIRAANPRIRLLTLTLPYALHFLPGQWLDVHVPGIYKAGGFTVTSRPSQARQNFPAQDTSQHVGPQGPYLELAVQESPSNPPATWLWQPMDKIVGKELQIRVGGRFTWPPHGIDVSTIDELVLIAGGVGINPLVSILSHLHEQVTEGNHSEPHEHVPRKLTLLYGSKIDSGGLNGVLFYPRIHEIMSSNPSNQWRCHMFLTKSPGAQDQDTGEHERIDVKDRRMADEDILQTLPPPEARSRTVAYVCGPAAMTDHVVTLLQGADGMPAERVLCEKWW